MAAAESANDWLRTPGIAHTSIRKMESWTAEKRMNGAVMLGWLDTPREQKMKENHDRNMNNLHDLYWKMKGVEGPNCKKEDKEEKRSGNLPGMPCFGTQSKYCEKHVPEPMESTQCVFQGFGDRRKHLQQQQLTASLTASEVTTTAPRLSAHGTRDPDQEVSVVGSKNLLDQTPLRPLQQLQSTSAPLVDDVSPNASVLDGQLAKYRQRVLQMTEFSKLPHEQQQLFWTVKDAFPCASGAAIREHLHRGHEILALMILAGYLPTGEQYFGDNDEQVVQKRSEVSASADNDEVAKICSLCHRTKDCIAHCHCINVSPMLKEEPNDAAHFVCAHCLKLRYMIGSLKVTEKGNQKSLFCPVKQCNRVIGRDLLLAAVEKPVLVDWMLRSNTSLREARCSYRG